MGASGYVVKSAADTELLSAIRAIRAMSAIRAIARGRVFVDIQSSGSIENVFGEYGLSARGMASKGAPIHSLSEREREVLGEVAKGYTNQQIADRVALSVKTIESYRARLMQKLVLRNRTDLRRLAIESGVLRGPDQV